MEPIGWISFVENTQQNYVKVLVKFVQSCFIFWYTKLNCKYNELYSYGGAKLEYSAGSITWIFF
jgi:hypothetical protein